MSTITDAIDSLITDCAKRDLVPSVEVVDRLLDLRQYVLADVDTDDLTPTPT
jgi:hypothetical protein